MSIFTVTITDPEKLRGITAARAAYNADLPEDGSIPAIVSDTAYVQFVMDGAAASYAAHYPAA